MRGCVEDATLVERSELIVVGRLKGGSIKHVRHKNDESGHTRQYHATLIVAEVLKGTCKDREIPLVIHHGLEPSVGGYIKRGTSVFDLRHGREDYPKDRVEVHDTSDDDHPLPIHDAAKNNLWFLCRRSDRFGEGIGKGKYGIADPEELRPLALKGYFLLYLSDDPEAAIREYTLAVPRTLWSAENYLAHREIPRIRRIPDVEKRLGKLLPYYMMRKSWNYDPEAWKAIIACGVQAGLFLLKAFRDPTYVDGRPGIIGIIAEIGYREAAPELLRTLESSNDFWRKAPLVGGRWDHGENASDRKLRSRMQSEADYSVSALRELGDVSATPAVLEAKKLWQRKGFESAQIVELCDRFLKKFPVPD